MGHGRNLSFSSSVSSYRTPSVSSRHTSNGSFSSSIGPGGRPQTSMSFHQSTTTRPTSGLPKSRPATSMDKHYEEEDMISQRGRNGMKHLNLIPSSFPYTQGNSVLQSRKLRTPQSLQSLRPQRSVAKIRDVSVTTAMSRLCLGGEVNSCRPPEHQAISSSMRLPSTIESSHKPSISTSVQNLRIDSNENALVLYQSPGDSLVAPKTPSHIPMLSKADAWTVSPATPRRTPRPSPQKTPYLTKDSNIPVFTAWDVHGRLEDMEAMYSELKQTLNGTSLERNGLEEAVAVYKARSQSSVFRKRLAYADGPTIDSCRA
jgi:kinesin family member C1